MRRLLFLVPILLFISACGTFRLVSDYDEVIDKGIGEFSEQLNAHMKNMAELGGKPEGTYDATLKTYNALDAKLDNLIARSENGSDRKGCKLQATVFSKVSGILKEKVPEDLQQGADATAATANACSTRLLDLVKQQLAIIREIHKTTDKCGPTQLSCIRPATAKDALLVATQSSNAVAIVETAKKSQ